MTRLAGLLRGQLDLPPDVVLAVLRVLNDSHCEEPLPDDELQAITRSASKWSPNPVLVVGNGHRHSLITGINESESDEPEAIDVSTLPEPPRRGWLVPDLLPEATVTSWYGDDGSGKSVLALALAICLVSGKPFLDRPVQQGTVLYVDTEFDQDEFVRRAYQLARGMGFAAPPAGVLYHRTRYSLTTPGGQRDIVRLVERHQPTLLIIDSITLGSYSSDLKEASETTSLMEFLQQLRVTTLALDHIPKPPPGASLAYARPWGSFAKRAKTRHAVLVTQAEAGGIVLRVVKSNLAKAGAMVGADITWTDDAIRVTAVSLDDDALAGVEHHLPALEQVYRTLCQHEAMTPEELAEETGLAVGTVRNKLTALRHQGRAEPVGDGRWRGIAPATLVVRDGGHRGVITVTGCNASASDDDPGKHHNPHREAKNGGHTPAGEDEKHHTWLPDAKTAVCEVCGQSFTWSGRGQPARYCSRTCQMKAYRQRQSSADAPGQGEPVPTAMEEAESDPPDPSVCLDCGKPITDPGFSYRCPRCLKTRIDRFARPYPEKLIDWLQQQEGRSLVKQGPDDIIGWGERLLAELRAGRVQLPVVEIKPGHTVLVPEQFLASHITEGKLGIDAATENLRRFRRALELVSERKQQQHGR
jgi:KaiC/GvpD/RAD55 family RecA-like ATPase